MADPSLVTSAVLVLAPVGIGVTSYFDVFDIGYGSAKSMFSDIGTALKERKIESWRYVFLGSQVDGTTIDVSDDHVGDILDRIASNTSLKRLLTFCKCCYHIFYASLLLMFCAGLLLALMENLNLLHGLFDSVETYATGVAVGAGLYIAVSMIIIFAVKFWLEKKYEKYIGI